MIPWALSWGMNLNIAQSPSANFQSSPGRKPEFIVLHGSGGPEEGTVSWIANPSSNVSYHYFLPKDCTPDAYQMVRDEDIAWHAGRSEWVDVVNGEPTAWRGMNKYSIGVSFESMNRADEHYPQCQLDRGLRLVQGLMDSYEIPVSRVVTHKMISDPQGRKIDPVNFPLDWFLSRLHPELLAARGVRLFLDGVEKGVVNKARIVGEKLYVRTEEG